MGAFGVSNYCHKLQKSGILTFEGFSFFFSTNPVRMRAAPLRNRTLKSAHCALCARDFAFLISLHPHKKFVPLRVSLPHMGVGRQSCLHSLALEERNTTGPFKTWAAQSTGFSLRACWSRPSPARQQYQPIMRRL